MDYILSDYFIPEPVQPGDARFSSNPVRVSGDPLPAHRDLESGDQGAHPSDLRLLPGEESADGVKRAVVQRRRQEAAVIAGAGFYFLSDSICFGGKPYLFEVVAHIPEIADINSQL